MKRALVVFLILLWSAYGMGCRIELAQQKVRVFRAERLEPEGWYRIVHDSVQACTGKRKSYSAIEWYVVRPGALGKMLRNGELVDIAGLYSPPNRIYLDSESTMDGILIGHELAHYITDEADTESFDSVLVRCGLYR